MENYIDDLFSQTGKTQWMASRRRAKRKMLKRHSFTQLEPCEEYRFNDEEIEKL